MLLLQVTKDCMQQQLAKVTAQLHALETEHNQLTGSNAVLEKVLQSHQLQLEILHDQQQVCDPLCYSWCHTTLIYSVNFTLMYCHGL